MSGTEIHEDPTGRQIQIVKETMNKNQAEVRELVNNNIGEIQNTPKLNSSPSITI